MIYLFLFLLCAGSIDGAREGEVCKHNDDTGVCAEITQCGKMIENPILWKFSPACQTHGLVDIVCCNPSTITETDPCEPLPVSMTASKTGRKAWDKCIEYQQLVFPCEDGRRRRKCARDSRPFTGSANAKKNEFPHAVLLGYTNDNKQLDWLCGGTLVSDRFILTVAHCVSSRLSGPVSHISINTIDRSFVDPSNIYKVKSIIKHPEYRPPKTYHDIALLELDEPVPLSSTTVPACLLLDGEQAKSQDPQSVIATSWSTNDVLDTGKTWLRKIHLSSYSIEECSQLYSDSRRGGYNHSTQVCYGDESGVRDICQDDGGSPLVVENSHLSCMYSVVGAASYGRGCFAHSPGVYTRPEPYLTWIEGVVWP